MSTYQQLDRLFEAAVIIDSKGVISYYNYHFSNLFKAPPRVIKKSNNIHQIIDFAEYDIADQINKSVETQTEQLSPEIKITPIHTQDKSSQVHVVIKVIPEKESFLLLFNDISIEKRLYGKYRVQLAELKETHEQILQADKLATVGELTASISHEISNPLTIAGGNVEIIETLMEDDQFIHEQELLKTCVHDIKESHDRINDIIKNMKTFLHNAEGQKEYYDLATIARESFSYMSPRIKECPKNIEFLVDDGEVMTLVNKLKLEQVFINLYRNSIDAIKESTRAGQHSIRVVVGRDDKKNIIYFEVHDTGSGIKESSQEKIFTPFYTTKNVGDGTGLGLSISKKIMEANKGDLYLLKSNRNGTCIRGELPNIEVISFTQNELIQGQGDTSNLKRILVVDDEPKILNLINQFISEKGMVFIGSAKPQDALKILEDIPTDLILVDYLMPHMNGSEFVKRIRDLGIESPVAYMTATENRSKYENDKDALQLVGMLEKPFDKNKVLEFIDECIHKSRGDKP